MANKQIFEGDDATFFSALKTALEEMDIFDSVTNADSTVTCTKDGTDVLEVEIGGYTVYNSSGNEMFSVSLQNTVGWGHKSITTCDGCAMVIITAGGNPERKAMLYIDTTADDLIFFGSNGNGTYRTACLSSSAADAGYGLNAPLSTAYSNASLYKLTAQMPNDSIAVARHCYGIRFSPSMHTVSTSAAGVTPTSITINGTPYITDGTVCMMDA